MKDFIVIALSSQQAAKGAGYVDSFESQFLERGSQFIVPGGWVSKRAFSV
jgi:hypothetical protein